MTKTNKKFGRKVSMLVSLLVGMVMLFSGISLISAKPAKNSSSTVFATGEYIIGGTAQDDYTIESEYSSYWHTEEDPDWWEYSDYDDDYDGIYVEHNIDKWLHREVIDNIIYEYYLESDYEEYKYDMIAELCYMYYNESEGVWYNSNDDRDYDFNEEVAYAEIEFGAEVIGYTTSLDLNNVVIPGTIHNGSVTVKELDYYLFKNCALKKITLGEGIKTIKSYCFWTTNTNYAYLQEITLPSTLRIIGNNAFDGCRNIKRLNLADDSMWFRINSSESIPYRSFGEVVGSKNVEQYPTANPFAYHSTVYDENSGAFVNGVKITSMTVPNDVKYIARCCLMNWSFIESITIPSSVKTIYPLAFENCNIQNLYIDDLKSWCEINIEYFLTFSSPYVYKSGSLFPYNGSSTKIFLNNVELTALDFTQAANQNITKIGDYAFYGWKGLTSVALSSNIKEIGHGAFAYCSNLQSLTSEGAGPEKLYANSFNGCDSSLFNTLEDGSKYLKLGANNYYALVSVPNQNSLTTYTINENTKVIAGRVFEKYTKLTGITIPNGVVGVGDYAFNGCTSSSFTALEIPDSVKVIGDYAFQSTYISSLVIGEGVEKIGNNAFFNSHVTRVDVDSLETWLNIEFVSAILPGSLYIDGQLAVDLVIPDGTTRINNFAFEGLSGLKSVKLPDSLTSIGDYAFSSTGLTIAVIPEGVVSVGYCAFNQCDDLRTIVVPSTLTELGDEAFEYCNIVEVYNASQIDLYYDDYEMYSNPSEYTGLPYYLCEDYWEEWCVYYVDDNGDITYESFSDLNLNDMKGIEVVEGGVTKRYYKHFIHSSVDVDDLFVLELQGEEVLAAAPEDSYLWTLSENGKTAYMVCFEENGVYGPLPTAQDGSPVIWRNSEDEEISAFQIISDMAVSESEKTVTQFTPPPPPETGVVVSVGSVALLIALVASLAVVLKKKEQY